MTSRKKPGVAFWATVALVVALLYIAGFGPACWLSVNETPLPPHAYAAVHWVYEPMEWLMANGPAPIRTAMYRYTDFWVDL